MNILHLKYAIEVEKTGSITQAADNLFMGQPNLSKAIRELENSLGITIFKRTSKGVVPTEKGQELLSHARSVLAQVEKMEKLYSKENMEKICYHVTGPHADYVAEAAALFAQKLMILDDRSLELLFKETNSLTAIASVVEGDSDMAVIRYQSDHDSFFTNYLWEKGLESQLLWEYENVLLMADSHPLAKEDSINYQTLKPYPELSYGDSLVPYLGLREEASRDDVMEEEGADELRNHIILYERGSALTLLSQLKGSFLWTSPLSPATLKRYNLIQRRCQPNLHRHKDLLIYRKDYEKNSLDLLFEECLMQAHHTFPEKI